MLVSLAWNYLAVSIGVGIAALVFLLLQKKLRTHYSAISLSFVWIAMACCLLIPVGCLTHVVNNQAPIEITIPTETVISSDAPVSASISNALIELPVTEEIQYTQDAPNAAKTVAKASTPINWPFICGIVWIAGASLFIFYQGIIYIHLRYSIHKNAIACHDSVQNKLDEIRQDLSIRRNIRIGMYAPCKSPFLIGILHPMILLPENMSESVPLEFVLKHELVHYKNHDILIKSLALLANSLHFYNPMAYVIRHELSLSRELVCDQQTLKRQNEAYIHAYGNSILNSQLIAHHGALTTQFGCTKSEMKERLSHMLNFKNKKRGIALAASALIITATASTVFAFNISGNPRVQAENTNSAAMSANTDFSNDITAASIDISSIKRAASLSDINVMGDTKYITNIMLLGMDSTGHTDCMMLLSINKYKRAIKMTSLMRDIYVSIPNHGNGKLNSAFIYGGYDLLSETIEQNFRIKVDKYISANYSTFISAVDAMGGVDIELTGDEAKIVGVGTENGSYHLNGDQALVHSRNRLPDGDFGRTGRQHKLFSALLDRTENMDAAMLTNIFYKVAPNIRTNMNAGDFLDYIANASTYLSYDVSEYYIPQQGEYNDININPVGSVLVFKDAKESISELMNQIYN